MGRLTYVDWMRGLACLLMFQTHAYDAWLADEVRTSALMRFSQLLGTFPAPLFLTLAGLSVALGIDRGASAASFARRGAEIFGIALLFRLQQWAIWFGWADWRDLLRVDVLNCIGISLALTGLLAYAPARARAPVAAGVALAIALSAAPLWTDWAPRWLPWWLASYVNGGHVTYEPKGWLFPLFPWSGFAFAGCAAGFALAHARRVGRERLGVILLAGAGALLFGAAWLVDQEWPAADYWRTSPHFFVARVGLVLVILGLCYAWPRRGWSPVAQLGTTSLLVYWVHIELVYGRLSILPKRACSLEVASLGLAGIIVTMTALSWLRTQRRA